jgi:hypothetical protein
MLFQINWTIFPDKRLQCNTIFSQMTPEDDEKDSGEHVRIIGRWHNMGRASGTCICESDSSEHVLRFITNWSTLCDIDVIPVVEDAIARGMLSGMLANLAAAQAAAPAGAGGGGD